MTLQKKMLFIGAPLVIIGVSIGLLALFRVQEAKEFSQPHQVRTRAGTNFVLRVSEVSLGKVDTGFVVMVYVQFQNPNSFAFEVNRNRFLLVGEGRNFVRPTITGTDGDLIKLPANGVLDREVLSYTLSDEALDGMLGLRVGRNYTVIIKNRGGLWRRLRPGEFRTFHRPSW